MQSCGSLRLPLIVGVVVSLVTPASKVTPEQALKIIDDERERMELEEDPAAAVSGKTA